MLSKEFEVIIGLEVHVRLKTASKMFCSCANTLDDETLPNTNVCPICMGHPGVLPVPNKRAIEMAILAGMALNSDTPNHSKFDRKHYFYPDLPKGYQISQYGLPFSVSGYLDLAPDRRIGITRAHLEEDAAKLTHVDGATLVDYNRAGTPLLEIVSEPDVRTAEEARLYVERIRQTMRYIGISDADMEKGQLRCDANISLRPQGEEKLYPKTEVKNMNSFRAIERAVAYEITRQRELWEEGKPPKEQSTRGWNDARGITELQRVKESAQDYRYFPEPDIPPVVAIDPDLREEYGEARFIDLEKLRLTLPELPSAKRERFGREYQLAQPTVAALTEEREVADYFEESISELDDWVQSEGITDAGKIAELRKSVANWMVRDLFKYLSEHGETIHDIKMTPENLAEFVIILSKGTISSTAAQVVIAEMIEHGADPSTVIAEKNLAQVSDTSGLSQFVGEAIKENPDAIANFKKGKTQSLQFLVGQVMRLSKGKANPKVVESLLKSELDRKS